jgi:integrase
MASINLYLRPEMKDSKGKTPIYLVFQEKGKKFKHFTGVKVEEGNWDSDIQEIEKDPNNTNKRLKLQKRHLQDVYLRYSRNGDYKLAQIKSDFKDSIEKKGLEDDFFIAYDNFLAIISEGKKASSIAVYEVVKKDLYEFQRLTGSPISLQRLNKTFGSSFSHFLIKTPGNSNSTVNKKLKALNVFCQHVRINEGVKVSAVIDKTNRLKTDTPNKTFLTEQELSKVFNLNLIRYPNLILARDLFLFGCFTGLKYTDIQKLKNLDIVNGKIKIIGAFGAEVRIPLNNYANMILNKYNTQEENCFPLLKNIYLTKRIKQVGKIAGLETICSFDSFIGDEKNTVEKPMYELLSSNVARITYAVLSLRAGMRPQFLMHIMGQKNMNDLMRHAFDDSPLLEIEIVNCWNKKVF